jgi:hypothetical protein
MDARPPHRANVRYFDLPPQLGRGLLVTILKPPSPLPARLDEPERLPLKVPIDVRGTARLVPLPFEKLPRFIMATFRFGVPATDQIPLVRASDPQLPTSELNHIWPENSNSPLALQTEARYPPAPPNAGCR